MHIKNYKKLKEIFIPTWIFVLNFIPTAGADLDSDSHLRTLKNFVSEKSGKYWLKLEILRRFIFFLYLRLHWLWNFHWISETGVSACHIVVLCYIVVFYSYFSTSLIPSRGLFTHLKKDGFYVWCAKIYRAWLN